MNRKIEDRIDLYECRLMKAINLQENRYQANLKNISVGLDLVHTDGKVAYYDEVNDQIVIKKCIVPWKSWKMDTLQDGRLFEDCLKGLRYYFEEMKIGVIKEMALVIPYHFSYFQRTVITQIAESQGIKIITMDSAGVFCSFSRVFENMESSKDYIDIICDLHSNDFEISLIDVGDDVYESLGTVGLSCDEGWNTLSRNDFEKRISNEIKQFFRDTGFLLDRDGKTISRFTQDKEIHVRTRGQKNGYINSLLLKMTGREAETKTGVAVAGAFLRCMKRQDTVRLGMAIQLSTYNRDLWVGLGDNGEKAIVVGRYTAIQVRKSVKLLLSTETELRIYEGNYFNPAYDCLLAEISLDQRKLVEGKEIECVLEIGWDERIRISVYNHEGQMIIDSYQL